MILAHAGTAGGVHSEYLVLAGAFLVLGVVLFAQKTVKPVISVGIVLVALALGSGAFLLAEEPSSGDGREVVILNPKPDEEVPAGEEIEVETVVTGVEMASCDTCSDGAHLHLFVDGETVAMTTQEQPSVKLKEGSHELAVEIVDAQHLSYEPAVRDTTKVVAQ